MAYLFTLAIECGPSRTAAAQCRRHFEGLRCVSHGRTHTFTTQAHLLDDDGSPTHWVAVLSGDLPAHGVSNAAIAALYTDVGRQLLSHLAKISCYQLAVLGVESLGAIEVSAFEAGLVADEGFVERFRGLVVSRALESKVWGPSPFQDFSSSHVAITPYRVGFEPR